MLSGGRGGERIIVEPVVPLLERALEARQPKVAIGAGVDAALNLSSGRHRHYRSLTRSGRFEGDGCSVTCRQAVDVIVR